MYVEVDDNPLLGPPPGRVEGPEQKALDGILIGNVDGRRHRAISVPEAKRPPSAVFYMPAFAFVTGECSRFGLLWR